MHQTTAQPSRPHCSPEQWQQLIGEWQHSGMSAKRFCAEQSIDYASFCKWRRRLSTPPENPGLVRDTAPGFIDLAALASASAGGWEIVLSLGNGVELKLSQR